MDGQTLSVGKKFLFTVVTFCLFILLIELGGQILFRAVLRRPFDERVEKALKYREEYLHDGEYMIAGEGYTYIDGIPLWTLVPRSVEIDGRTVNALGFSEREVVIQPDRTALFVVGDSMMHQSSLSRRTTDFMQQMAEKRGEDLNVFNFSLSGYNLLQEAALIRSVLIDLGPDMIYWIIFIHNDFEDLVPGDVRGLQTRRDLESYRGSTRVLMNFYLTGYVYQKARSLLVEDLPALKNTLPVIGLYSTHHPLDNYPQAQKKRFKANYREYARTAAGTVAVAREGGVDVRLYLLPNMQPYMSGFWDRQMSLFVEELRERYGIEVVNLKSALLRHDLSGAYDKTDHFTEEGARIMAGILYSGQHNAAR